MFTWDRISVETRHFNWNSSSTGDSSLPSVPSRHLQTVPLFLLLTHITFSVFFFKQHSKHFFMLKLLQIISQGDFLTTKHNDNSFKFIFLSFWEIVFPAAALTFPNVYYLNTSPFKLTVLPDNFIQQLTCNKQCYV